MDIGIIGLGRMGAGMARRWLRHGHRVVVNNRSHDPIKELEKDGAIGAYDLPALVAALPTPTIWIMLPAGATTEQMIENLVPLLSPGDTLIDSGNTNFNDDIRRALLFAAKGINYIDQGTSGGIWGLEKGFCLMVGGEPAVVKRLEQAFIDLAPVDGYLHSAGGQWSLRQMVPDNGVEYGMMQALCRRVRNHESAKISTSTCTLFRKYGTTVVWCARGCSNSPRRRLRKTPNSNNSRAMSKTVVKGVLTIQAAIDLDVPAPVITLSLFERFHSRRPHSYVAKCSQPYARALVVTLSKKPNSPGSIAALPIGARH
jgi:6-phosphogluconate dehydrogenase